MPQGSRAVRPTNGLYLYLYLYVRTYIHTFVHTYIRTYIHTYKHTYIHTYIHTYVVYRYIHTNKHTYIYTYIHSFIHSFITYIRHKILSKQVRRFCRHKRRSETTVHTYLRAAFSQRRTKGRVDLTYSCVSVVPGRTQTTGAIYHTLLNYINFPQQNHVQALMKTAYAQHTHHRSSSTKGAGPRGLTCHARATH